MKIACIVALCLTTLIAALTLGAADPAPAVSGDALLEGFKLVEVASVADATEQLYGERSYMARDVRGREGEPERHHRCRRGWSRCCTQSTSGRGAQARSGTRRYGTQDVSVHREVQKYSGSG